MTQKLLIGPMAALLILCAAPAFSQQSLDIGSASVQGLMPATVDVSMTSTGLTEGFVLAISYDTSHISVMNVVISAGVAGVGAELVSAEIFEAQGGLTLGVVLDSTAPFNGQTIPAGTSSIASFDGIPDVVLPPGPDLTTALSFTDGTFNNPPLDNIIVQGGLSIGAGQGLGLNDGSFTCGPPPPDSLTIEDTQSLSTGCAAARVLLNNQSGPVQGFVTAIAHDDSVINLTDINLDGTATDAAGAEFVVPSIETGGGTLGVVLDFNPPFAGQTIAIGAANHIANYVYCCKNPVTYQTGEPVPPSEFSPLTFADGTFGSPTLDNVIVVAGLSLNPGLVDGTFECVPVEVPAQDTMFACGTMNSEGDIVDVVGQLGSTVEMCFFYKDPTDNIQGFQLALCFDCNLCFIEGTFSIEGTILEAVGAEFVSHSVDNDPDDGDGCELTVGILLDALPPFDRQTVPQTATFLKIGGIDVLIKETAPCNVCLPVQFCDFVNGSNSIPIENVVVIDNQSIQDFEKMDCNICTEGEKEFIRGDCNDDVKVDIADAATVLEQQFQGFPVPCLDACDANDDGKINLADAVHLLNYLFDGGAVPPPPSPSPIPSSADQGPDPTDDDLDCENGRDSCAP